MKTHKHFWLVGLVVASLLVSGCGGAQPAAQTDVLSLSWDQVVAQAKTEGEVVFYSWWGEEYWREAARLFEEEYGIKATVVIGECLEKTIAEKDAAAGTVDVCLIGGQNVKTSVDAGLWYGPIFPKMPSSAQLDQNLAAYQEGVETQGYLVPIYRNQTGFLYDPERVPDPPQTWDELTAWIQANPKGFAFCDPNKGGSGQAFVQTVLANLAGGIDKYKGDTEVAADKVADWGKAWEWFNANEDLVNVTVSNNESIDLLNQGAASLIVAWDDDSLVSLSKGTLFKRAELYIPEMGLPGGGDTAGVLKNAPHKAAGMLFIDFLTSVDMQKLMNATLGSTPARTDIADSPSLIPEDQRQNYSTPWVPAAYKAAFIEEFTKNVLLK
jgi:putative spermidine/putrescine transport system substrate-binding protein